MKKLGDLLRLNLTLTREKVWTLLVGAEYCELKSFTVMSSNGKIFNHFIEIKTISHFYPVKLTILKETCGKGLTLLETFRSVQNFNSDEQLTDSYVR